MQPRGGHAVAAFRGPAALRVQASGLLAVYGHPARQEASRASLGFECRAVEGVDVSNFWRDRPVFITGATGLVGGWLTQRLVEQGASVVCLVRDWVPRSSLLVNDLVDQVTIVRGDVRDQALLERVLGEYEIDTVHHLAAQTIVGIANRNPVSTFESNIQGTWSVLEAARRSPMVRQIVMASSVKTYGHQP